MTSEVFDQPPRVRRDWRTGMRGLAGFFAVRSSLENTFEALFALAERAVDRGFRTFAPTRSGRSCSLHRSKPSLGCVDYEALLPLPLDEARKKVGLPSFADAQPRGLPSKGRRLDQIERNINGG